MMGRAEKRMAKKRQKKGPQYQGGRPISAQSPKNDVLSRDVVLRRLAEIPVFSVQGSQAADGSTIFYLDSAEAEKATTGAQPRVVGRPLSEVYFGGKNTILKPSDAALRELASVPAERRLVPDPTVPLFAIDGFQTTDKDTQVNSLPLFLSKAELLDFATPVYGADEAKSKVLVTNLSDVVANMLNGPAGLLRNAKFFPLASALEYMDKQEFAQARSMFPQEQGKQPETLRAETPDAMSALKKAVGGGGLFPS